MDEHRRRFVEQQVAAALRTNRRFSRRDEGECTFLEGWVSVNGGQRGYRLRVDLSPCYPTMPPDVVVTSPQTLWMYGEKQAINSLTEASGIYHVHRKSPEGLVRICHCELEKWDPNRSLSLVIAAGALWCFAHSEHLRTGVAICDILKKMKSERRPPAGR